MIRKSYRLVPIRRLTACLILAGSLGWCLALPSRADEPGRGQTRAEFDRRVRESKARALELLSEGARSRMEAARRWAAAARHDRRRGLPTPARGARQRPAPPPEAGDAPPVPRIGVSAITGVPTNVRANNPAGDLPSTIITQSEEAIAAHGNDVLIAWNDGQGPDVQGYGYSTDGGQTFVDGGVPPRLPGWTWTSDPMVTVNEKTGVFYYAGLVTPAGGVNGIGVVPATFSGSTLTWGTPVLAREVSDANALLDKEWMVADSASGNLYLTYTTFDAATVDHIDFQRSTNGGATWSTPVQISSVGDNGGLQGSRPVVGPAGELYATWSALGPLAQDFIRLRKSANQGSSWGTEVTPVALYQNFGTGAPGFNRERGVDFPSIAVDRTFGTNRGRVHLTWTESINKYDDPLNTLGNLVEAEPNGFFSRANAFTPGRRLRGAFASISDLDYFKFSAIQGANYIFECDSIPDPLYSMRVFCGQDTLTPLRLAFTGDLRVPAGGRGYILWTAPSTGTYYLRMATGTDPGATPDGYRISTAVAASGSERGRDSRDVFACHSDNGSVWSTPVRVNDAAPDYDEFLPEIMVGADGMPYVTWFDWRDDGCGGRSFQYLSRSQDGGATWSANQPFSDVQNDWTTISSNLQPNMGDYSHICTDGRYLRPAWADGRGGSADVFTTRIDTWDQISVCQPPTFGDSATIFNASWTVENRNPIFGGSYAYSLTCQRNWPMPPAGTIALGAAASGDIQLNVAIPDTARSGEVQICLSVANATGALRSSCCFDLTVNGAVRQPPPPFELESSVPDPAVDAARIDYSLPQAGAVRLRIYGPRGERVRTLVDGDRPAGPNSATWDGRDDAGRPVGAGIYLYRLEGLGQTRTRRLVWLK